MKTFKPVLFATLFTASLAASASNMQISGSFDSYDENAQTISIVNYKSGDVVTYKYSDKADIENQSGKAIKLSSLRKGTNVTLKLAAE